jgi:hypothetical protein
MKRSILTSAAAIAVAAVAGCESAGLSPREVPGRSQSAYLYALYADMPAEQRNAPLPPMRLPASVAVVQVGEAAPPAALMATLRGDAGVFGRVETLPGVLHEGGDHYYEAGQRRGPDVTEQNRAQVSGLRSLAADLGMDYLLLVGGTVDYGTSGTPLSVMDLTIVGAFVVPSRETRASAKANGALIDVRTGRVLVNSSAEADRDTLVPSISVEGAEMRLLTKLRDEVLVELGKRVLADTRIRAASAMNAAAVTAAATAPGAGQATPQAAPANVQDPAPAGATVPGTGVPAVPGAARAQHYDTVAR